MGGVRVLRQATVIQTGCMVYPGWKIHDKEKRGMLEEWPDSGGAVRSYVVRPSAIFHRQSLKVLMDPTSSALTRFRAVDMLDHAAKATEIEDIKARRATKFPSRSDQMLTTCPVL
jgi:hypothetical protein